MVEFQSKVSSMQMYIYLIKTTSYLHKYTQIFWKGSKKNKKMQEYPSTCKNISNQSIKKKKKDFTWLWKSAVCVGSIYGDKKRSKETDWPWNTL